MEIKEWLKELMSVELQDLEEGEEERQATEPPTLSGVYWGELDTELNNKKQLTPEEKKGIVDAMKPHMRRSWEIRVL